MIDKRRFAFTPTDGRVDLYLNEKKVVNNHRGETGNYYFRIPADVAVQFDVAEHDSTIPIEATVTPDGLEPVERKPRIIGTGKSDSAEDKLRAAQAADDAKAAKLLEAQALKEAAIARAEAAKAEAAEKTE